ncbi:MAG: cytochrome C oxidase subunit IV family protein [Limisphaerales bacterium]
MAETHAHAHAQGEHSHADHKKHVRTYWLVFAALVVGTVVTVWAWTFHLPSVLLTVALALLIAGTKASLVAGWFMHLVGEQKMIYVILGFTVFFFLGMMLLTLWSHADVPRLDLP